MCQRQIMTRVMPRQPLASQNGILAVVLERTEHVRLDVLAAEAVTIQGHRPSV